MQTLTGKSFQLVAYRQQLLARQGALPSKLVCRAAPNAVSKVTFKIQHHVDYGQELCITGSDTAIGQWDPKHALVLHWSAGDVWHAQADVPVGAQLEYKFIVRQGANVQWQQGNNKGVSVPDAAAIEVTDSWGQGQTNCKIVDSMPVSAPVPAPIQQEQQQAVPEITVVAPTASISQQHEPPSVPSTTASVASEAAFGNNQVPEERINPAVSTVENIGAEALVASAPAKPSADVGAGVGAGSGGVANNIVTGLPAGVVSPVSAAADHAQVDYEEADRMTVYEVHGAKNGNGTGNGTGNGNGNGATATATLRSATATASDLARGRTGPAALDHLSLNELRSEAKRRGVPSNGNRRQLIAKLQDAGAI